MCVIMKIIYTVDSKIIRQLDINCVKKLLPNAVLLNKYICQVRIFRLYTVYKHEMIKIGNKIREK